MRSEAVLEFVAKQLVDHPSDVRIEVSEDDREVVLELHVHDEDLGKVIGKRGRTAKALRTLVKAAGALDDENVTVEIVD
ncbi:MAG: KH domain-containing protein [Nitriliruptor sp.]|uniref:KH domain-containing protein n=1 Tax=Nitriliruptor sp. TaxID=2448056 RepID=UPI00349FDA4E